MGHKARSVERIAHRGASRELPENTLAAFERAFERGADGIELDVHATGDDLVVVHHDPSVHGPEGEHLVIAATPWSSLGRVRFADGSGIARLDKVLDAAPDNATVYVEIKGAGIEELVAATIEESGEHCAVHSFDHEAIVRMLDIAPDIPRGVLFEHRDVNVAELMKRTEARDAWPHWKIIDAALVNGVHEAGGRVIAWTVNDRDVAERLVALGVDGLCGDDVRIFDGL